MATQADDTTTAGLQLEQLMIPSDIDVRLQRVLDKRRRGVVAHRTAATKPDEVAVIAKVSDLDRWAARTEIRPGALLGRYDNDWIVTARVPVARVADLSRQPEVVSLKAAQRLRPLLAETLAETMARRDQLPAAGIGDFGRGVVVGIVDFGCDFAHGNFRFPDGSTRIEAIWDQTAGAHPNSPFGYGRLYRSADINAALAHPDPYAKLGYRPEYAAHGTHVTDIAAGNGGGSGQAGVAGNASIIFVEVASDDVPWSGEAVVGRHFGDSVQLLEAVRFIFEAAGDRPCVVNLSLGTNGGPHDGTSLVEEGLDAAIAGKPNRAVVIAASNSYADHIHASGQLAQGQSVDLEWQIASSDVSHNELELWYAGDDEFAIELIAPDGRTIGSVALGASPSRLRDSQGRTLALIAHSAKDPNNGANTLGIFLESGLPVGTWRLRLQGKQVTDGTFHAWIERDDRGQSSFAGPLQNDGYTLGSISCGHLTIVVGSYDAHRPGTPLSYFSSAGPTRDGRLKPEISAPGHDVWAACSPSVGDVIPMSGTSMAAPAVSGVVALVLAEAHARGRSLSGNDLRTILQSTARGSGWHDRYGYGRINAAAAVHAVI